MVAAFRFPRQEFLENFLAALKMLRRSLHVVPAIHRSARDSFKHHDFACASSCESRKHEVFANAGNQIESNSRKVLSRHHTFDVCKCEGAHRRRIGRARRIRFEKTRYFAFSGTAARCCRLVEREIAQQVDALLERPSAKTKRRSGQFREMFRRGRVGQQPAEEWREPAVREPELTLVSTASMNDYPVPDADIAASALGPLEVRVAGQRVPRWTSLKARAVFQYLLVHQDRPTRRDVLMALQWPAHSHNSARNNLNVALYSLRNTLDGLGQGAQPIVYRDGCYILNPDLTWWVDRTEFLSAVDEARRARRAGPKQSSSPIARPSGSTAGRCSRMTAWASGTCRNSAV